MMLAVAVSARVHGRSEDRGYVVPQASDLTVAGDARWGGRPMAEHRVMSEDLLDITHYRSRRCYESQCHLLLPCAILVEFVPETLSWTRRPAVMSPE